MHNANHILVRRRNSMDSAWEEVLLSPSEFKKMLDTPEPKPAVKIEPALFRADTPTVPFKPAAVKVEPVPAVATTRTALPSQVKK